MMAINIIVSNKWVIVASLVILQSVDYIGAIPYGEVECLHKDYDRVKSTGPLELCCIYHAENDIDISAFSIYWEFMRNGEKDRFENNFTVVIPNSSFVVGYVHVPRDKYEDLSVIKCKIFNRDDDNLINSCKFEVALFTNGISFQNLLVIIILCLAIPSIQMVTFIVCIRKKKVREIANKKRNYSDVGYANPNSIRDTGDYVPTNNVTQVSSSAHGVTVNHDIDFRHRFPTYLTVSDILTPSEEDGGSQRNHVGLVGRSASPIHMETLDEEDDELGYEQVVDDEYKMSIESMTIDSDTSSVGVVYVNDGVGTKSSTARFKTEIQQPIPPKIPKTIGASMKLPSLTQNSIWKKWQTLAGNHK